MTTTTDILDRIHVINQSISYSTLQAYRYFDHQQNPPFIFPIVRPEVFERYYGDDYRSVLTVDLIVVLSAANEGVLTQTAQKHAELVIDPVLDAYGNTAYLETSTLQSLSSVIDDIRITQHSGIVYSNLTGRLQIIFTLEIPILRDLE